MKWKCRERERKQQSRKVETQMRKTREMRTIIVRASDFILCSTSLLFMCANVFALNSLWMGKCLRAIVQQQEQQQKQRQQKQNRFYCHCLSFQFLIVVGGISKDTHSIKARTHIHTIEIWMKIWCRNFLKMLTSMNKWKMITMWCEARKCDDNENDYKTSMIMYSRRRTQAHTFNSLTSKWIFIDKMNEVDWCSLTHSREKWKVKRRKSANARASQL